MERELLPCPGIALASPALLLPTHQAGLLLLSQLCIVLRQGLLQVLQRCVDLHGDTIITGGCCFSSDCRLFITALPAPRGRLCEYKLLLEAAGTPQ